VVSKVLLEVHDGLFNEHFLKLTTMTKINKKPS